MTDKQNTFDAELACVEQADTSDHNEAVQVLLSLADSLDRMVFGFPGSGVIVIPGFTSTNGQQYRIVAHLQSESFTLLRAYVPSDGYPTTVDPFGVEGGYDGTKCANKSELEDVLKRTLRSEAFRLKLKSLRILSRHLVAP